MISSSKKQPAGLTFVLAILGDYGRVESALARSIERLEEIARRSDCQIVAAMEDSRWETVPLVQTLGMRFAEDRLRLVRPADLQEPRHVQSIDLQVPPARLFSAAAERAEGQFLQFLWPGCLPDFNAVNAACSAAEAENFDWLAFAGPLAKQLPELCSPELGDRFYSYYFACGRMIPLCQAVVRRTSFLEIGGLDASPLLQREFDADFWLRAVRHGQKGRVRPGSLAETCWTWEDYPLQADFRVPRYLSHSYRVRNVSGTLRMPTNGTRNVPDTLCAFAADLPPTLQRTVDRLTGHLEGTRQEVLSTEYRVLSTEQGTRNTEHGEDRGEREAAALTPCPSPGGRGETGETPAPQARPYKIAVTGGPWEFAHNQLCFFNHFAELEGRGLFTYVPLLDQLIVPERDLRDIDAVIISRGRHANLRKVLDYCQRQSIATLYMIDDNWLRVGKDWPKPYASIFAPGRPQYEMFLSCLRECDATLVYNDVLAEDVWPFAGRVIRLPVNVRQADFTAPLRNSQLKGQIEALAEWRRQTGGVVAGYLGSLRYHDGAFQALAACSRRPASQGAGCPPVKVVLFGVLSPQQQQLFGPETARLPYVGYDDYAAAVGTLAPDILVAPLDASRTSMSKCANKYLEYSMAGAAGVYSNMPPYTQTIVDGRTGLLVGSDDEASWSAAIARLVENSPLRQSIAAAARRDVLERFETGVVAPVFARALQSLIRGEPGEEWEKGRRGEGEDSTSPFLPFSPAPYLSDSKLQTGHPPGGPKAREVAAC